jgi:hypothetical protein
MFMASWVGAANVCFEWDASEGSDLAGYRIYQRGYLSDVYDYAAPVWEGTETTCTISVQGHPYYYVARAYNVFGEESADSNEVIYTQPPASPTFRFCIMP